MPPPYPRWPDRTDFDLDTYAAEATSIWERLLRRFSYLHRVGHADGLAPLGADGLVPDEYLPESSGGGGGAVDSVNGQTGAVVLDADDVGALDQTAGDARYVRTVNGVGPDGSGNVTVDGGGGSPETPSGTGREDTYTTSISASSGSYSTVTVHFIAKDTLWVEAFKYYGGGGGVTEFRLYEGMVGQCLATESFTMPAAGSPAMTTIPLTTPVKLTENSIYTLVFIPTTSVKTYRWTGGLYNGTLWQYLLARVNGFLPDTGSTYSESSSLGIVEYS